MPKTKKEVRVDLTLLKRLVSELEVCLANADRIREEKTDTNVHDYIVEMSKGTGLAANIVQEATLLVGDIRYVIKHSTSGASAADDALDSLLGALKGGSGLPGAN